MGSKKPNIWRTVSIALGAFLLIGILIAVVVSDIPLTPDEEDEVIDEISTYTMIKDEVGKYTGGPGENRTLTQIAILITPIITKEVDLQGLHIKLDNGEQIKILNYTGNAAFIQTDYLFKHALWTTITADNFGFLVVNDDDTSITQYHMINKNTDMAYVIMNLSADYAMKFKDVLEVTLFPETGWQIITNLEAPLPVKDTVTFD